MMSVNAHLHEQAKIVLGFPPGAGGSGEDYVSLKGYHRLTIIVVADNATTVTGSAVTLKQALNVAGGTEIALPFDTMWGNVDTGATDTLVKTTVTSDTFTTDGTDNKNLMYVMEIVPHDLSVSLDYCCVRIDLAAATASTLSVIYILWSAKDKKATPVSAILD